MKIEVACSEEDADRFADAIITAANTGTIGDGKIFITTLGSVVRIRTGERDEQALTG